MSASWLRWRGRDNRLRERGHPIGWICGDLQKLAYGSSGEVGAVEAWKRAQRRALRPEPKVALPPPPPDEAAKVRAEARALNALLGQGMGFEEAVGLVRGDSARRGRSSATPARASDKGPVSVSPTRPEPAAELSLVDSVGPAVPPPG
jgi:hypothetical protein